MPILSSKNILIGLSSSIAVYKVVQLIRKLSDSGANVKAIISQNTFKIITREKIGCDVHSELFIEGYDYSKYKESSDIYPHITLAKFPELIILAPATANIIGKIANGIADDLLTTVLIASKADVFVCPAMNANMYSNPIVLENIYKLQKHGYKFIGPEYGELGCGDVGNGRLSEPERIYDEVLGFFNKKNSLIGKRVLVTAGALSEPIDQVRVITNKSSGKMGVTIANEVAFRGAEVTLIRGDTVIVPSTKIKDIKVSTGEEMLEEIKKNNKQDIVIHSAAVPDFRVEAFDKKLSSSRDISLNLKPTTKILDEIKKIIRKAFVVGFKAEYKLSREEIIEKAYIRLKKSGCDMIIANDVGNQGTGFYSDNNEVYIIDGNKEIVHLPISPKKVISERIIDEIIKRL